MSYSDFNIEFADPLSPLSWWESYMIRSMREFPRESQLKFVDLLSRFLLVYRCLGAMELDTEWLKRTERLHGLTLPSLKTGGADCEC